MGFIIIVGKIILYIQFCKPKYGGTAKNYKDERVEDL